VLWEVTTSGDVARDAAGLRYRVAPVIGGGGWSASASAYQRSVMRLEVRATRAEARAECEQWAADVAVAIAQPPLFADLGEVQLGDVVRASRPSLAPPEPDAKPAQAEPADPRQMGAPW
jgi:hypothetical protein